MLKIVVTFLIVSCIVVGIFYFSRVLKMPNLHTQPSGPTTKTTLNTNPLSIAYMRAQKYPGSDIVIEQTLFSGTNYSRYIASYKSQGLTIYALLTVPFGQKPKNGWPVIVFNHGYIPPLEYRTTERYIAYTDAFSRNGYIVFKPDYRGNGNSQGSPSYPEFSPAYTIDVLNAISSIKKYTDANPQKIGLWGHSMAGMIILRSLVISKDISAAEIWAGVVGTYADLSTNRHGKDAERFVTPNPGRSGRVSARQQFIKQYGDFNTNPTFWQSIDPMSYLKDITIPIQLQHATTDEEVPDILSEKLTAAFARLGKKVQLYSYEGDNHNLSNNLSVALERSVTFFDTYLK